MKLIDLLVQELPRRGGWPDGVNYLEQYIDGSLFEESNYQSNFKFDRVDDFDFGIITREQYESALAVSQNQWNGEGLPPVGCECERQWCGDEWLRCTVLFVSDETIVVKLATREAAYGRCEVSFRPIRSKRQTAVQAMCDLTGNGVKCDESTGYGKAWYELYDAIATGKIPHIQLK